MTDRQIAQWSLGFAAISLVASALTLWQLRIQYVADYDAAVFLTPGVLPLKKMSATNTLELNLEVTNTAKINIDYFLRVNSNFACVNGNMQRDPFFQCTYESQIVQLSKSEAGSHKQTHKISIQAAPGAPDMNPFAYQSDPKYFLSVEVIDARNGKALLQSICYYTYTPDTKVFGIYMPAIDTLGESRVLQSKCQV